MTTLAYTSTQKKIPNGVLGILFFLTTEVMFFAGLISAYLVNRAGVRWPPIDQPRLPVEMTTVNTFILLSSAVTLFLFWKNFNKALSENFPLKISWLLLTIFLGAIFISIQGNEWIKLLSYGLTTTSSIYGAFFYTIIGAHGFHVLIGIALLLYSFFKIKNSFSPQDSKNIVAVCSLYWCFVVGIWPVLYVLVYLV